MGIRLSEKHGVNPTMGKCMWCGEPTGEIALLGKLKGDVEAPRYSTLSYEPCDKCKEIWSQGVALVECTPNQMDGRSPYIKDKFGEPVYPTGRVTVIIPEAASHWFGIEAKAGMCIALDETLYQQVDDLVHKLKEKSDEE